MLCCEVLKPRVILVVIGEEVVGCTDCVGESHCLVNDVVQVLVCVVTRRCGIADCKQCEELLMTVLDYPLMEVVSIKYAGVELCEVTKEGGIQSL